MTFSPRVSAVLGAALLTALGVAATPALAAQHTVEIAGLEFQPPEITIAVGDTVIWEVTASIGSPHSVTSGEDGSADLGQAFDSGPAGLKDVGETFQHTFEEAGTFPYFCTVHGEAMSGEIVVTEAAAEPPGGGHVEGIPTERKLISAGILVVTLVILFGAAAVWRRMNTA